MKRIIFPCLLILLVFTGCKNSSVKISGTLDKPLAADIYTLMNSHLMT